MTTTTITTIPQDVPIPAGVAKPDIWQNDVPQPYRVLFGEVYNIDAGTNYTTVQTTAVQFTDGRIDDGSVHEPPRVYLGDDALTSAQARELADLLVMAADEADRWGGTIITRAKQVRRR